MTHPETKMLSSDDLTASSDQNRRAQISVPDDQSSAMMGPTLTSKTTTLSTATNQTALKEFAHLC